MFHNVFRSCQLLMCQITNNGLYVTDINILSNYMITSNYWGKYCIKAFNYHVNESKQVIKVCFENIKIQFLPMTFSRNCHGFFYAVLLFRRINICVIDLNYNTFYANYKTNKCLTLPLTFNENQHCGLCVKYRPGLA